LAGCERRLATAIEYNALFPFNYLSTPRCRRTTVAMPIYEYRCSSCGHELESLQKLSDPPLVVCPSCRKEALVKLVSAAGFQLKGTGWYVTDFRGSSGSKAAGSTAATDGKPAESKSESKSESSSDSTSAATAASATTTAAASAAAPGPAMSGGSTAS